MVDGSITGISLHGYPLSLYKRNIRRRFRLHALQVINVADTKIFLQAMPLKNQVPTFINGILCRVCL